MKNEYNYNEMKNTLVLLGFSVKEEIREELSTWRGDYLIVTLDNLTLTIDVNKQYVGYINDTKDAKAHITPLTENDTIQGLVDDMLQFIITHEVDNEPKVHVPTYKVKEGYSIDTVKIPGGKIPPSEGSNEYIEEFEMTPFCITWHEWDKYIKANPDKDIPNDDSGFGRGDRPVINVSKLDIDDYILWLNEVTGEEYSLPTQEQWELAARAGTNTDFYTGDNVRPTQANYYEGIGSSANRTSPVGSFMPNKFGLYDMMGNVRQWTKSVFKYD